MTIPDDSTAATDRPTGAPRAPSAPGPPLAHDGPLTPRELGAWRGLLQVHAQTTQVLDAQMRERHGITVSAYEVLMFLGDADGHRLRMAEIAERVLLSRSGLTRLVDRLVDLGLVTRSASKTDGRGLYAQLTPAGASELEAARRTHRAGVRQVFLDQIDPDDQAALAEIWGRYLEPGGR